MDKLAVLESTGFSKAEALVYVTLLKLGRTKSGRVIKITGLQSSVVHNALNTLIEKGFASYVLIGKIKHYQALDPSVIKDYLDAKKNNYLEILPELKVLQEKSKTEILDAEIYEGYKGLFAATLKLVEGHKKGEIFRFFAANDALLSEDAINFFERVDRLKKEKGIIVRGIADELAKKKLKGYNSSDIRFVNQKIPPAMNIFRNKIIIMSLSDKPVAVLIESGELARQYGDLWDSLWGVSKPA